MKKIIIAILLVTVTLLQSCATPQLNKPPEVMFREGEQSFQEGNYEDAVAEWKRVKESYHSPELSARAEIGIADAYFLNKDFIESAAAYEDFRKLHPSHERAGYALYRQGMSNYNQITRIDTDQMPVKNAQTIFESYIKFYSGGEHTAEVLNKLRDCRDKQLQYEIYVGRFYLKLSKYPAAIARFEEALKNSVDSQRRDELLYYLGRACLESGQKARGREVYGQLFKEFPQSLFVGEANKVMDSYF